MQGYIPAEGLGVSPNSLISPKIGGQGVEFNSWVSPNPLGGAARVADEASGECLERAAVGCAFAIPTLRFGRVQGIRPCRGFGGILGAFNSPLQALSRDGVRLRRTRVRGAPESSYPSPKIGGQGVDVLSLDGMAGSPPIDKTASQWIEWSRNLGLS